MTDIEENINTSYQNTFNNFQFSRKTWVAKAICMSQGNVSDNLLISFCERMTHVDKENT